MGWGGGGVDDCVQDSEYLNGAFTFLSLSYLQQTAKALLVIPYYYILALSSIDK